MPLYRLKKELIIAWRGARFPQGTECQSVPDSYHKELMPPPHYDVSGAYLMYSNKRLLLVRMEGEFYLVAPQEVEEMCVNCQWPKEAHQASGDEWQADICPIGWKTAGDWSG